MERGSKICNEIFFIRFADLKILTYFEDLILVQDERWRRGLGMQVERSSQDGSGERERNTLVPPPESGIARRKTG